MLTEKSPNGKQKALQSIINRLHAQVARVVKPAAIPPKWIKRVPRTSAHGYTYSPWSKCVTVAKLVRKVSLSSPIDIRTRVRSEVKVHGSYETSAVDNAGPSRPRGHGQAIEKSDMHIIKCAHMYSTWSSQNNLEMRKHTELLQTNKMSSIGNRTRMLSATKVRESCEISAGK